MSSDDSYLLQRIAFGLIRHAASVLPPGRDHWAEAMAAELDHIPKSAAALQWALGCVLASYSERMRTMTIVRPPVSRWVLLVEMLAFFSFPTLGLFAVLANLATISGLDVAWLFSVAILGPIGLVVGFKAVVLNRPSLSKPLTWALTVLAAWTLVAYLLYMLSRSGGTSLDWWRGYILIALLPAVGTAHLIYLARSARATPPLSTQR
jgi:hypothetical protein